MKVYSALPDLPPSTEIEPDIEKKDNVEKKKNAYPYQDKLKSGRAGWLGVFMFIGLLDFISFYYNPEEFFYPCNYTNIISINDTLELQSQLHEVQKMVQSYESQLQIPDIPATETEKYNLLLKNAIEESTNLNATLNYHKKHWTECFKQNFFKMDKKIILCQLCIGCCGLILVGYEIYLYHHYSSKIKNLKLTEAENEAYEKEWKGWSGLKFAFYGIWTMFFGYCFSAAGNILRYIGSGTTIYPIKMPYF